MPDVFDSLTESTKTMQSGLPGLKSLNEDDQHKELVKMFRRVFSSGEGKIVLGVLLEDMHYFNSCDNAEEMALSNYAKKIVREYLGNEDNMDLCERLIAEK